MRTVVIALIAAWGSSASADIPKGITERVTHFILDGCDFFTANPPQPRTKPADKKLATHFGRIIKSAVDGIRVRYDLKVAAFDGWDVSYWARGVDLKIPPTVAVTMGDLQHWLGNDHAPDVDYAMSANSSPDKPKVAERVFEPSGHGVCRVFVDTEADVNKAAERRVFSLRFAD